MHTTALTLFGNANRLPLYFIKLHGINPSDSYVGLKEFSFYRFSTQAWGRKDTGYERYAPSVDQLERR